MVRLTALTLLVFMCSIKGFSQEGPLKAFTEENPNSQLSRLSKVCLYPSTLRMVNISKNKDYNDLVKDIEKILIYRLDSDFMRNVDLNDLFDQYKDLNYEEYASVKGTNQNMVILGNNSNTNEVIGFLSGGGKNGSDLGTMLFYLKGSINWQKIPTLMKNFQSGDIANLFDLVKLGPD